MFMALLLEYTHDSALRIVVDIRQLSDTFNLFFAVNSLKQERVGQ
jgi:hypothetical protein